MTMRKTMLWLLLCGGALAACGESPRPPAAASAKDANAGFRAEENAWRQQRRENLLRPDGWTSLIGLHWIQLKAHFLGSSPGSGIRLAKGPEKMGLLQQQDGKLFFTPERGAELTLDDQPLKGRVQLFDDKSESPSVIGFDQGKGKLTVIERGGRHALRVKHADADTRTGFAGLDYWPADPSWKIEGRFVANAPGKTLPIPDIIGDTNDIPNPGAVEFQRGGKTYRIEALDEGDGSLFLIFADRTNGHGSYGAGRFLDAGKPDAAGKVVLDFNRAYNPPCAFTPFATCPLPPPENRLDLAVLAGEKQYGGLKH
ncbi:DUF1684 domain-containing protein [Luteimonas aquatica]|uniref:DUF1684 domain-containing protein n=1 Tax=Luteimonas aquatica TaxID=450364 RepID=UPI003CE48D09